MNKLLLKFLCILILLPSNIIQAALCECVSNSVNFIKNNPGKAVIGTVLVINAFQSGKKSIVAYGLNGAITTAKILPKLCSTKILLTTVVIGGAYFVCAKN